jgi:hypothetical protein
MVDETDDRRFTARGPRSHLSSQGEAVVDEPRGLGRALFAAVFLLMGGVLNIIWGIAAIGNANFFRHNQHYVFSNLKGWGWITLIIGILEIGAAASLLAAGPSVGYSGSSPRAWPRSARCSTFRRTRSGRWRSSGCACGSSTGSRSTASPASRRRPSGSPRRRPRRDHQPERSPTARVSGYPTPRQMRPPTASLSAPTASLSAPTAGMRAPTIGDLARPPARARAMTRDPAPAA